MTFSFFVPEDFPILDHHYEHISLGQFHGGPNNNPGFKWDADEETYQLRRRTGCWLKEFIKKNGEKDSFKCSLGMKENNRKDVISKQDLKGKWHDVVINIKWSRKQDGYFKQWINGKLFIIIWETQVSQKVVQINLDLEFIEELPIRPQKTQHKLFIMMKSIM